MTTLPFPHSTRATLRDGLCPCGCGGGIGYRPLFTHEQATDDKGLPYTRQTTLYRTDKDSGRPLARMVIICRHDTPAVAADLDYRAAEAQWRADYKSQRSHASAEPTPTPPHEEHAA